MLNHVLYSSHLMLRVSVVNSNCSLHVKLEFHCLGFLNEKKINPRKIKLQCQRASITVIDPFQQDKQNKATHSTTAWIEQWPYSPLRLLGVHLYAAAQRLSSASSTVLLVFVSRTSKYWSHSFTFIDGPTNCAYSLQRLGVSLCSVCIDSRVVGLGVWL